MRFLAILLILTSTVSAQDFQNRKARKAEQNYQKQIAEAREEYIDSLEEAAADALENDQVDEALAIKSAIKKLEAGEEPVSKRVLWKHPKGYFERLNDGNWVSLAPGNKLWPLAQTDETEDYVELKGAVPRPRLIRIYHNHVQIREVDSNRWEPLRKGMWVSE